MTRWRAGGVCVMSMLTDVAARFMYTATAFQMPAPPPYQIAQANPARFAIGFAHFIGDTGTASTSGDDTDFTGFQIPITGIQWITVKDHGPLAQSAWFLKGMTAGHVITVYEVIDNLG